MAASAANLPGSTNEPQNKKVFTPLRVYLILLAFLVVVVTSPFTVGPAFAAAGVVLTEFYHTTCDWAARSPLTSWFLAGGLGVALVSAFVGAGLNDEAAFGTRARGVTTVLVIFLGIVALEYLFICLPVISTLATSFGAAGGTPEWLNGLATIVLVVLANAVHISLGLGLMFGMVSAVENSY
ncbi:hypothetical protein [Burkholderia ubonensis]|uniref:hypothetical protein n=1 Tax=Burkholderia ubonensis TaxID=101571 RepID=UPI00075A5FCF|nr:hypothetical protein [Burkholderia ubonensis]KVP39730.1 hypothetical protein WJ87_05975 [Burkholderia ubonensis]